VIKVSQSFCLIVQTRYKIRLETAITFAHPLSIFLPTKNLHEFYFCTPGEDDRGVDESAHGGFLCVGGGFCETVGLLCSLNIDYRFNELGKKLDDLIITGAIQAMD